METLTTQRTHDKLVGGIDLAGSKSIANRALIIQALCKEPFEIKRMANAQDVQLMQTVLSSDDPLKDVGPAGTTYRFSTAYFAMQEGEQILTGTERMKQRPIGLLVDALRSLGANIAYMEKEGYPPLKIGSPMASFGENNKVSIPANTSSQYLSALLMIAPVLPNGLELTLVGDIVSRPYLEMTLSLMSYFGVNHNWEGQTIKVAPQDYQAKEFTVEADWSAASYYYAMAAFSGELDLQLDGLFEDSLQGDAVLVEMMEFFGVQSNFNETGVRLTKKEKSTLSQFEKDFIKCPDLAQTLAVVCAGTGIKGRFTGLQTLRIKETDRIEALDRELTKVNVSFKEDTIDKDFYIVNGKANWEDTPSFATYEDHRMAMAFAPLAMLGKIEVQEPKVVGKSYPDFWKDLESLGFEML
ncbi:MAG: 3-phosphoshikimate 1-carboxyvinyltransferase [Bacteroidota bacterium]